MLDWMGWLEIIGRPLEPAFRLVGLPGQTVVAFVTGMFINIYSGIAALGSIPLTSRQVTILALAMLISHNLPIETAVQSKTGTPTWRTVLLRLMASFLGAMLLNLIMPSYAADAPAARLSGAGAGSAAFWPMLGGWAMGMAALAGKVFAIVIGLMILQRLLREFGIIPLLGKLFYPLLWLLGLPKRCAFLWIVANTLGLAYGAGVIVEEVGQKAITPYDAQLLNRSIAICHSLLEDTLLFVAIGAWALWITFPRLAMAAVVVWTYRIITRKSSGRQEKLKA
jgi:spore maturation protein SpmB